MRYLFVTSENTNRIHALISWLLHILLGQASEEVYLISNAPSRYCDTDFFAKSSVFIENHGKHRYL
ncbi:unnamed protein product [Tuber melanosporum]|uniref:(Perigord truffle) hypothetical protein n=1 Tax=Tuber melanosporum (strain Mel28) TaxID=656061 RepID=D5GFA1_TUBMM|nr:uncharacterized protein GSTUM_00006796001 [Tuber melanosporum]CAZ83194.1 unnamed protein product [Tuber melanosporum]